MGPAVSVVLAPGPTYERWRMEWTREKCLEEMRQEGGRVLLSFSRGKDSLAAWCVLRDAGFEVIPFHMVLIWGLEFVEEALDWYERHFGVHIYQVQHPTTWIWLNQLVAQPPHRLDVIEQLDLPTFSYADLNAGMKRTAGLQDSAWVAVGTRLIDNPIRRMMLKTRGPLNHKLRQAYPIFDMRRADQIEILKRNGVLLPVDYEMFARSFDGIDYRFLAAIKSRYPKDYQTILEWFPMQDMEFARVEFAVKHGCTR